MADETQYRVTIREFGKDVARPKVIGQCDELAWALYHALVANDPARIELVVADLVCHLGDCDKLGDLNCFEGHRRLARKFWQAAADLAEGWRRSDEALNGQS